MKSLFQGLLKVPNTPAITATLPLLFLLNSFKPIDDHKVPESPVVRREIKTERDFKRIRIEGDISVILTNDPAGTVIMEGKEKQLNKIRTALNENTLVIDVNRTGLFAKVTLYLSAVTLQNMQLNGNADISSIEFIKSDHLHISLNGNINVKVKTMGWVSLDAPDDIDLLWKSPLKKKRN